MVCSFYRPCPPQNRLSVRTVVVYITLREAGEGDNNIQHLEQSEEHQKATFAMKSFLLHHLESHAVLGTRLESRLNVLLQCHCSGPESHIVLCHCVCQRARHWLCFCLTLLRLRSAHGNCKPNVFKLTEILVRLLIVYSHERPC